MNSLEAMNMSFEPRLILAGKVMFNYDGETSNGSVTYEEEFKRYSVKLDNRKSFDFRLYDIVHFPAYMYGMDILSIRGAGPTGGDVTMFLPTMNLLLGVDDDEEDEDE